jgi:hypothetical protein
MRIVAFITEAPGVRQILVHFGEPTSPPRLGPARGLPRWEMADAGQGEMRRVWKAIGNCVTAKSITRWSRRSATPPTATSPLAGSASRGRSK